MNAPRYLTDLSAAELKAELARAEDEADIAQYADSLTPKRKADERIDAIKAEIARRHRRQAT